MCEKCDNCVCKQRNPYNEPRTATLAYSKKIAKLRHIGSGVYVCDRCGAPAPTVKGLPGTAVLVCECNAPPNVQY